MSPDTNDAAAPLTLNWRSANQPPTVLCRADWTDADQVEWSAVLNATSRTHGPLKYLSATQAILTVQRRGVVVDTLIGVAPGTPAAVLTRLVAGVVERVRQ